MKNTINLVLFSLTKINKTHLQFALMLLTLVMLVIGAGAQETIGGSGR
jgi:hypothetical protein